MPDNPYFPSIRRLAEYEVWCNRRSLETAEELSTEELFRKFEFGFKTIHATLFHVVEVLQLWSGCVGPVISKPAILPYDQTMSLKQLVAWNERLSDAFMQSIDASHSQGLLQRDRRIEQIFHLVTH